MRIINQDNGNKLGIHLVEVVLSKEEEKYDVNVLYKRYRILKNYMRLRSYIHEKR